jgi:hypothetical protein
MKVKLGMIKLAQEASEKLLAADLPVKTAWKLRKAFNVLKKELEDLEEMRLKLVNKYGTPDKTGGVSVLGDKLVNFLNEFNPLLEQDIEITYDPVPISEILNSNINFSSVHLSYLEQINLIFDNVVEVTEEIDMVEFVEPEAVKKKK